MVRNFREALALSELVKLGDLARQPARGDGLEEECNAPDADRLRHAWTFVQQDDRAGPKTSRHCRHQLLRGMCAAVPTAQSPAHAVQRAFRKRVGEEKMFDPDGRAENLWPNSEGLQHLERAIQFRRESSAARTPEGADGMGVRVMADLMTAPHDFRDELRRACGAFTNDEERCACGMAIEQVENPRRILFVGTVIYREPDRPAIGLKAREDAHEPLGRGYEERVEDKGIRREKPDGRGPAMPS